MSKQVDERVVSMQFDNKNFEKNVSQTMSSLDKFKQKLNLTGASKGLENVNAAAKKVDMNGLATGVETVRTKFSALEVMGVTALANITNSAVNAGKRIVNALTIAPIKTGFNEYELKMGSIQTIMASTGEELKTVNKYLEELNAYSDQTIYSFQDMTQNIGKFTNAGVGLKDAVLAIKGISNEAAVSGATANEASRAMYNFAQALSSGYVKLIDWKSIELANMATVDFKEQLIGTAVEMGTLKKGADGMYDVVNVVSGANASSLNAVKNFNDSLGNQWMTSEVLIGTLKKYADANTEIGKKATQAATEVKTFSQMLDTLKESAQSGWAQTWELLVGDFYEGKTLWTSVNNVIGGVLDKISDVRNTIIKSTFAKSFSELGKKVKGVLEPIKTTADSIKTVADAVKDYGKVVDEIIDGKWGNGQARWDKLTESGYDWAHAQNLVNEKLGNSVRHATKYKEAQNAVTKSSTKLTETEAERLEQLVKMSDAELEALGYTKKQIEAFRDLKKAAEKVGMPISEFINKLDEIDGKWLMFEGFANLGRSISGVFKAVKTAWQEIFNPNQESIIEKISESLFNIIAAFHRFSRALLLTNTDTGELNENGDKLRRTFKGIFAALDIVLTIVGGPLKIAFKVFTKLLEAFNLNILDITAYIGDAIVRFRDWVDSIIDLDGIIEKITPYLQKATDTVRNWFDAVKPLEKVADIFKKIADKIKDLSITLYNTDIVQSLIHGLTNGLKAGGKMVWEGIKNLAKGMINTIKRVLGIHSPSTEFKEVGENAMIGLLNGLKSGAGAILGVIASLCSKMIGAFAGLDWSNISTIFTNIARLFPKLKIFTTISAIGNIAVASGKDVTTGLANGIGKGASAVLEAIGGIATALINTFKSILGIHSPSKVMFAIGGFLISGLIAGIAGGEGDLTNRLMSVGNTCVDVIKTIFGKIITLIKNIDLGVVLAGAFGTGLLIITNKISNALLMFGEAAKGFGKLASGAGKLLSDIGDRLNPKKNKFKEIARGVLELALAIGILCVSVYVLTKVDPNRLWPAIGALAALAGIILLLSGAAALVNAKGGSFGKLSVSLIGITAALWILASVLKKLSFLNKDNYKPILGGLAAMIIGLSLIFVAFGLFVKGKAAQNINKAGGMLIKMSLVLLLMVGVMKIMSTLEPDTIHKGGGVLLAFSALCLGLIAMTQLAGNRIDKVGPTILKISAAMLLMALTMKVVGGLRPSEIEQGLKCILTFGVIIIALVAATRLLGRKVDGIGQSVLGISAAMVLMAITTRIMANMKEEDFKKGLTCIVVFGAIIVGLIWATKLAGGPEKTKGLALTILAISVAIGILAAVSMLMSLISPAGLAKGITAVGALGIIMALLIKSTKGAQECKGSIMAMTAAIAVMVIAVAALSMMNPTKVWPAIAALSALMLMFGLMAKMASSLKTGIGSLIVMTVAIGIMAGAIYLLAQLPIESTLGAAAALSMLVLSLSASMFILTAVGKFAKDALLGVLALTAMAVPLLAFVGVLALMQNVQNALPNVIALTTLATAMTLLLIPLTIVGAFGMAGLPYLGVLALLAMAVPLLAFVGILALMQNIQNATQNATLLINLMTTMTKCLVAISLAAPLALVAVAAIKGLLSVMGVVGLLVLAVGALVTKFPQLETFIDTGLPILEKLATGIGSILGKFVSGFAVSAMSGLPEMGMLLSQFMINATPFIVGAKMLDAESMAGVKALAEVILILTAADIIQGLTSWLTGGSSLTKFGEEIGAFGPYLRAFAESVAGIDGASVQAAASAAKALAEMTATIPNEGGVAAWFAGENSIAKFSEILPSLGTNLRVFAENVAGIDGESTNAAIESAKALAEMTSTIPNEGGVAAWFAGENSIAKFANNLPGLGAGIKGFADNVNGINAESVSAAVTAAKAIVDMSSEIPNEGGVAAWFAGDNSISKFSSQLGDLGTAIKTFATNVGGANVENINKAVNATKSLSDLLSTDISGNISTMEKFGKKLVEFGKKLSEFCKKMGAIKDNAISSAIDKFNKMVNMSTTLNADNINKLSVFGETLIAVAKNGIKEFISALNSKSSKADAKAELSNFVYDVAKSIETKSNKNNFKNAGKYLIEGLADGIRANKSTATKAAQEVAGAVESIIRAAWKINSPSKVFYKIALGVGEGITNALGDSAKSVKYSAGDLANTATNGFGNAIQKIAEFVNSDMDTQPTIRPVLDLSDVRSGVNAIGSMFATNRTLAVSAPGVGAISASMASRQNGNNDLVSAINKLAKSNGTNAGNTYNINGISYSEGSDVAEAIQTLVRATTIEGRT